MNLDQTENYDQDEQDFRNEKRYDDPKIESAAADHSISDNAEPDFGNDLSEEFNNGDLGNENLGNTPFENGEFDHDAADDEFEKQDEEELGNEEFANEGLDDDQDKNATDY